METVTVTTRLGDVTGVVDGTVQIFRGMRYAEAPTGERRFLPPVPAAPWEGVYDATCQRAQAMQLEMAIDGPIGSILNLPPDGVDEDCLFLTVNTPKELRRADEYVSANPGWLE